jgi:O-antigen/teichoic acid export membrane protein
VVPDSASTRSFPSIAAAFAHTIGVRAAGFVLGFVNSVVVARGLGVEGRGQFSLLLTAALFLGLVLAPLTSANTILTGREPAAARTLAANSAVAALLAALAGAAVLFAMPDAALARFLGAPGHALLALLALFLGVQVFGGALNGLLLGRQEFYFTNHISLLNGGATLALNVAFIVLLGWHVGGALLALGAGWAVVIAASLIRLRTWEEWPRSGLRFSAPHFREGLAIGGRAIAANLPVLLMLRSDIFLVQYYMGVGAVGVYSIGVVIAELILIVGASLNSIAFAKAASEPGAEAGIARAARFALVLTITGWFVMAATAHWFFPLAYGAGFAAAATPAVIVMAGIVAWNFQTPLAGFIVGRASYPAGYIGIVVVGFVANVILNVILIPRFGLNGAAAATAAAYTLTAFLVTIGFARMTGLTARSLVVLSRADLAAGRALVAGFIKRGRSTP